jgi:hypothetical protein
MFYYGRENQQTAIMSQFNFQLVIMTKLGNHGELS